jgi:hypothetical protein
MVKYFIKEVNKVLDVKIVNQWVSEEGEEYVTLEYYNHNYNVTECNSYKRSDVDEFQKTLPKETPKNGNFDEW